MPKSNYRLATFLTLAAMCCGELEAKGKHPKTESAPTQDQIAIDSHIAAAAGPITRFVVTRHYDRTYVYAEREASQPLTLIDITDPSHPRVLSKPTLPIPSGDLLSVAGTAALTWSAATAKASPQTIRLLDFSDPAQPKVSKQFDNVTAVEKLPTGVILLANADGIWILSQHFADDPAVEDRYAKKVIYGESIY